MAYSPFPVQVKAHRALLVDEYKRAVLYWSRRCFTADTLVATKTGERPISAFQAGDEVFSLASEGQLELVKVVKVHRFGVDTDPKPMLQLIINGRETTASYDHPYRVGDEYVPLIDLAWGAMAPSERLQFKLLCEQYGQDFDDISLRWEEDSSNETSPGQLWVLENSYGRQDSKSSQNSSTNLAKQSPEQATGEPHRQRQSEQSNREPGVGDKGREPSSHDESGQTEQEPRRTVRHSRYNQKPSIRDTQIPAGEPTDEQTSHEQALSRKVPIKSRVYSPHLERQDLEIRSVRVLPAVETYDLETTSGDFFANGVNVHNTGKTAWSMQQLMMSCMINQGPHHIVFKEYTQAEQVAWNQYIHLIPEGLIKDTNKSTLTVTFHHFTGKVKLPISKGSCKTIEGELQHFDDCDCLVLKPDYDKPPASIRFLGSDKADSHRGGESYGMIFDEYQDQDHYGWDFVYRQFLYTTGGWAVFMGTAKADDAWIEMLENAEMSYLESLKPDRKREYGDWYYSKATWRENPLIKPEIIEADRQQAEREGKMGAFLQETELIPFTVQGAVYPMYSKKTHHIDARDVPANGTDYIFLDFGFAEGHPMAACFVRITRDDIWYQWDEIHGIGIQLDDLIAEIRTKMGDRRLAGIIADSARPDLIDYMASKGMPVIPAPKKQNSVAAGIQLFSRRLRPKMQIVGSPKPNFFIDTVACPKTHYDFMHYRYKEAKEGKLQQENPDKRFDDSMDALRYGELFFKFGVVKDDKLPTSSVMKEFNQFGLL